MSHSLRIKLKIVPLHSDYYTKSLKSLIVSFLFGYLSLSKTDWQSWWSDSLNKIKKQKKVNTLSYKTLSVNKETAQKEWVEIDATGQKLGRLASKVAVLLRGKHKPSFTPHVDCGDNVIIINADKVELTGNKWTERIYLRYSGYPSGQRESTPADLMKKGPDRLFRKVVKGMLPKNKIGDAIINNMYVYAGETHPHEAQKPEKLDINKLK